MMFDVVLWKGWDVDIFELFIRLLCLGCCGGVYESCGMWLELLCGCYGIFLVGVFIVFVIF